MPAPRTIGEFMTKSPVTIERSATMARALKRMVDGDFRHLPVVDGGRCVGILSERDLRVVENMRGVDSAMCVVGDFLRGDPYAVTPDAPLRAVARDMAEKKVGSAVVLDGEAVVGVFTTTDALRVLAEVLEAEERSAQ